VNRLNDATPEMWDAGARAARGVREPDSMQIGGNHYANKQFQPIEYITANNLDFAEGNIIKYVTRHKEKNGKEDILKALHYCKLILKYNYGDNL